MFCQISQIHSLKDFQDVPLSFLTAIYHSHYTQYSSQHLFPLSFLSFLCPSPFPFGIMLLWLIVFYPFQFNLSPSHIKLNANSIPLSPSFCLALLLHLAPALVSLQPNNHTSGALNTFIISSLLLSCIVSWDPASILQWSGTVELNVTWHLQLLAKLHTLVFLIVFPAALFSSYTFQAIIISLSSSISSLSSFPHCLTPYLPFSMSVITD